jgi:hypothetical protein
MTDKNSNSAIIRKFNIKDKEAVRRISYDTAFMGQPSAIFIAPRLLVKAFIEGTLLNRLPYTLISMEILESSESAQSWLLHI